MEAVSVINNISDCPGLKVQMISGKVEKFEALKFELTSVNHPLGKCCKAIPPPSKESSIIGGLLAKVYKKSKPKLVEGYQIFLSDRETVNRYHKNFFNIEGEALTFGTERIGYKVNLFLQSYIHSDYFFSLQLLRLQIHKQTFLGTFKLS